MQIPGLILRHADSAGLKWSLRIYILTSTLGNFLKYLLIWLCGVLAAACRVFIAVHRHVEF